MAVNPSWLEGFRSSFTCMCYGNVWRCGCTNIRELALTTSLAGHADHLTGVSRGSEWICVYQLSGYQAGGIAAV